MQDGIAKAKEYYDFSKVILRKPSRNSYRNLSDGDKEKNKEYGRNECKNAADTTMQKQKNA